MILLEKKSELNWSSNYDGQQIPESVTIKPLEIIKDEDELIILKTDSLIFEDTFFSSEIHVTNKGQISLENESLVWSECGFRFENEIPEKNEHNQRNLIKHLAIEDTFPGLQTEIDILQDVMLKANEFVEEPKKNGDVMHEKREKIMIEYSRQLNKIKRLVDNTPSNDVVTSYLVKRILKDFDKSLLIPYNQRYTTANNGNRCTTQ